MLAYPLLLARTFLFIVAYCHKTCLLLQFPQQIPKIKQIRVPKKYGDVCATGSISFSVFTV